MKAIVILSLLFASSVAAQPDPLRPGERVTGQLIAGAGTELREATDRDRQSWQALQLDRELSERLAQGDTTDALDRARRLAALYESTLSEDPPGLAQALLTPGALLLDARAWEAARLLLEKSVAVLESLPAPDPDLLAEASFQLGRLEAAENRFAEAERLYLRARGLWEQALGPAHRSVAVVLTRLADLYRAQGRYGEAEVLYLKALSIVRSLEDPEGVARCLNSLGVLYVELARYADAQRVFEEVFEERAQRGDEASLHTFLRGENGSAPRGRGHVAPGFNPGRGGPASAAWGFNLISTRGGPLSAGPHCAIPRFPLPRARRSVAKRPSPPVLQAWIAAFPG